MPRGGTLLVPTAGPVRESRGRGRLGLVCPAAYVQSGGQRPHPPQALGPMGGPPGGPRLPSLPPTLSRGSPRLHRQLKARRPRPRTGGRGRPGVWQGGLEMELPLKQTARWVLRGGRVTMRPSTCPRRCGPKGTEHRASDKCVSTCVHRNQTVETAQGHMDG